MELTAVLFDMDGLMIDSERLSDEIWVAAAARRGWTLTAQHMVLLRGTNREEGRRRLCESLGADFPFDLLADETLEELTRRLARSVPLMPGLTELLAFFSAQKVKMAVASSTHRSLVESNLRVAGVRHYFDAVICGDMVRRSKPAPDIYLQAAAALGQAPQCCMVLEDSYNGVRAGAAAGCCTVMVPNMDPATPEMERLAKAIVPSLAAVPALWEKLA